MADTILDAIQAREINPENISFSLLRNFAGRDCGCWGTLGRGRAILASSDQLDQYLYSYGPMTKSQWDHFLMEVTIPDGRIRIVDYGCGQGLAGALLFDYFGLQLVGRVERVILIEPSNVALARAKAVLECYCNNAQVLTINKKLDGLTANELRSNREACNLHLFSNVLDIDGFQHFELFSKILQTAGSHIILAVSHNRDFHGGAARFRELELGVADQKHRDWFVVHSSIISEFNCVNGQPAISWQLHIEVLRGSV